MDSSKPWDRPLCLVPLSHRGKVRPVSWLLPRPERAFRGKEMGRGGISRERSAVGSAGFQARSRDLRGGRWSWTLTFAQKRS